jgi:hypothetical protein
MTNGAKELTTGTRLCKSEASLWLDGPWRATPQGLEARTRRDLLADED